MFTSYEYLVFKKTYKSPYTWLVTNDGSFYPPASQPLEKRILDFHTFFSPLWTLLASSWLRNFLVELMRENKPRLRVLTFSFDFRPQKTVESRYTPIVNYRDYVLDFILEDLIIQTRRNHHLKKWLPNRSRIALNILSIVITTHTIRSLYDTMIQFC